MRQYKLKKCKRVQGIHFSADGRRLLAVGGEEVRAVDAAVWLDLSTGENVGRIGHYAFCYAVDPLLERYILGGAKDCEDGIAEVQWTGLLETEWEAFPSPRGASVTGMAFDPTGTHLAMTTQRAVPRKSPAAEFRWRHHLRVVQFDSATELAAIELSHAAQVIASNADATRIAVTGGVEGDPPACVYDLATRRCVFEFEPRGTVSRYAAFLPGDRLVVANGRNVYILPAEGGEPLFTLSGHPKQVNAVALAPDGRRLLTASHDGSIRTWNADTGEPGAAFDWGIGAVTAVAFAPDGLTCAAAGLGGKVVVWDVGA